MKKQIKKRTILTDYEYANKVKYVEALAHSTEHCKYICK